VAKKIEEFNSEKTVKEMAELLDVNEKKVRNAIYKYNLSYKKSNKGNPNFGKKNKEPKSAESANVTKLDEQSNDIVINKFIDEYCLSTNNIIDSISVKELKDKYQKYCSDLGLKYNDTELLTIFRKKFKTNTKFTAFVFVKFIK